MDIIEGTVESIVFQSENKQFCVFRIRSAALGMVTAVYRGPAPFMGETVQASGSWTQHARFGRQFTLAGYRSVKPGSAEGVERFLASGAVKGIGKAMASRIVEHFGRDTPARSMFITFEIFYVCIHYNRGRHSCQKQDYR